MIHFVWFFFLRFFLYGCKLGGEVSGLEQNERQALIPIQLKEMTTGETITLSNNGSFQFQHEYEKGDSFRVIVFPESFDAD